jgi:hypothetical protein
VNQDLHVKAAALGRGWKRKVRSAHHRSSRTAAKRGTDARRGERDISVRDEGILVAPEKPQGGAIMKSSWSMLLAAVVVSAGVEAWAATEEEKFLGVLKKVGVTETSQTSKRPCLCVGGGLDGTAGRLVVFKLADRYHYECRVSFFNLQGDQLGSGGCVALGGSLVVLTK